ncbi:hypothetical protein [Sphingomonas glaciei]|uniref:Uncharacterized protein n=1 Tax=Sphingomonas glaciei TaxID=2938948 RepID=A0ABY5MYN0_9SPHN|nr:hypothetical protein [Sphingomonas glaciei]UUR09247.1 hypothetical protein M1K48_06460 [Sphingomonas glaciei]
MLTQDLVGRARVADDPQSLTRVESLLMRYPELSAEEVSEAGKLLRRTGPLDMGLLSANPTAWTQVERFRGDHPGFFRPSRKNQLLLLLVALLTITSIILLWDSGLG